MRPIYLLSILMVIILGVGCSSSNNSPLLPIQETENRGVMETTSSHTNWGLWQFIADPDTKTLDVIQLRTGAMHLNALKFVNEPAYVYLTVESLGISGNIIDADIGLRHPFLGLTQFTGFDVKGILISDGSLNGFTDSDINIPGAGDTHLLNPDGYSRWWNPNEFPDNGTILGYMDGLLGQPYSIAGFTATVNGYKSFCDDLDDPYDPLSEIDPEGRGVFSPGMKNVRHYTIEMSSGGLIFNYAVDANWKFPVGTPPWEAPGDFAEEANQPEAYRIEVTELPTTTLYYDEVESVGGGDLFISIDVYDWFGADLHTVKVEWPGFAAQAVSAGATGGGVGYSTYEIDLPACTPSAVGNQPLLVTVESEVDGYGGIIPGEPVSAYFIHNIDVPPGTGAVDPVDICTGWNTESGYYMNSPTSINNIFTQISLASDSNGGVWMWAHRTGNALSRSSTAYNGDWGNMWEEKPFDGYYWIFKGNTIDVSLTPTYNGELIAGCSPNDTTSTEYPNPLSIAWWDGSSWHDKASGQWLIYDVTLPDEVAKRINGYRDSANRFHAFCQINAQLLDYYSDTWQGSWSNVTVAPMPEGQPDYACQTRTDFVAETSDGYIYLCWVDNGLKVARCQTGTTSWNIVFQITDPDYDSPTLYIDEQDRIVLVARYYISDNEDQIHLFTSTNGTDFGSAQVIFNESCRVDPCYLVLKGDTDNNLFLSFPYRPGTEGAYAAIIAGNPGGSEWTDVCVLSDNPLIKCPALAVRPDGSLEVCYGLCNLPYYGTEEGATDNPFTERNLIYGKSNPGFLD